jgi:hypothetical protein
VAPVHNLKAVGALVAAVVAIGILAAAAAVPRFVDSIQPLEALIVVPAGVVLSLLAISLARRARFDYQRSLGRIGGNGLAAASWVLGMVGVLIALAAALAVGVYAVLTFTQQ